jgi:hypothetical protein
MSTRYAFWVLAASTWLSHRAAAQPSRADSAAAEPPATTIYRAYYKLLPADLPQAKLLFVRFRVVAVLGKEELAATMSRPAAGRTAYAREHHNAWAADANRQLVQAAARYPFAYRITSDDSVAYYAARGYRYKLFHDHMGAAAQAYYAGSQDHAPAELYLKDLVTNDQYIFASFSKSAGYNYRMLVGKLISKVERQFKVPK